MLFRSDYALALVPSLPIGSKAIALLVLAVFTVIQLQGVRAGSGSQLLLSLAKTVAFLLLVAACFLLAEPVGSMAMNGNAPQTATDLGAGPPAWLALAAAWVLALQAIIGTYDGWHSPIYFAEEFSEPAQIGRAHV